MIRVEGAASRASKTVPSSGANNASRMTPTMLACSSDPVILDQGIEAILRPERVAHSSAAQAGTADRPGTRDDSERALGDDRLMRAMKGTEAEVDNADVGVEDGHRR